MRPMRVAAATVLAIVLCPSPTQADTTLQTSGFWDEAANWSNGRPSIGGGTARIGSGRTATVELGFAESDGIALGLAASQRGTIVLNRPGSDLTTSTFDLGDVTSAEGVLEQRNGKTTVTTMTRIGAADNSRGSWYQGAQFGVQKTVEVGAGESAIGTLTIEGGSFTVSEDLNVGGVDKKGRGNVVQTGGSVFLDKELGISLRIGNRGAGDYNQSGGIIRVVAGGTVGGREYGVFTQTGGDAEFNALSVLHGSVSILTSAPSLTMTGPNSRLMRSSANYSGIRSERCSCGIRFR